MTKKDIINKFKTMEGKEITTLSQKWIVGYFKTTTSNRVFPIRMKVVAKRLIEKVSQKTLVTKIINTSITSEDLDTWYSNFIDSLSFNEELSQKDIEDIKNTLSEEFLKTKIEILEEYNKKNKNIYCDFPKVKDIKVLENGNITMYETEFKFN